MEAMKAHFDFLKHLTTLDTASALIVVTIYKELNATLIWTTTALVLFGISLVSAVIGMSVANLQIRLAPSASGRVSYPLRRHRFVPAFLFLLGLGTFVYGYALPLLFPQLFRARALPRRH
jgi:hypothetical protein